MKDIQLVVCLRISRQISPDSWETVTVSKVFNQYNKVSDIQSFCEQHNSTIGAAIISLSE